MADYSIDDAQERAQIGFTNMARQDPEGFVDTYNIVYACETATLKPLHWESLMNQAARFHSWELAMTSSFQHETTDEYAFLFDGDAGTFTRLDAFADLSPDVSQASSRKHLRGPVRRVHGDHQLALFRGPLPKHILDSR